MLLTHMNHMVQVPPGLDHASYWQPSYLNIDVNLLAAPKATLQVSYYILHVVSVLKALL
jgi:hypothetical protein